MVGPTIQDSLMDIITRFRCHPIAFTADIVKMYRQVKITDDDQSKHRIFWREDPAQPIQEYSLTYGTASAPYLAVRVLQQLSNDEQDSLPLAAEVAKADFHVDDLMSGADTEEDAIRIQDELLELMRWGCLELRKWSSNSKQLAIRLPEDLRGTKHTNTDENVYISSQFESSSVKTLGIHWNTTSHNFHFKIHLPASEDSCYTKRIILSGMSRLFDPLGWLAPVIVVAKILIQSLWKLYVGWDEVLPIEVQQQ
jgi:hypothetical protein